MDRILGLSKKLVISRTALVFSPVSLKRYENTALRKVSEQVFQTFQTPPMLEPKGGVLSV